MSSLLTSKSYALRNAGQLLARTKAVDQRLMSLKVAFENADEAECPFLLGKISGLRDNRTATHKSIIDTVITTQQELKDGLDFNEGQAFLKGYLQGAELILQIDRELFDEETNFIFFVYSQQQDLIDRYLLVFRSVEAFSELNGRGLQYFLSTDPEEICARIEEYQDSNQFIVVVLYEAKDLPSVATMQTLAAGRQECIYLHKASSRDNVGSLIYKFLSRTTT